jgi:AraC family transcriptional regulator, arabinose operon regulatory protein
MSYNLLTSEILSAGYSYHNEKFHYGRDESLKYYLFRLQTEGLSSALVEGSMSLIESGDLLLYQPGQAYELLIEANLNAEKIISLSKQPFISNGEAISSGDYYLFCKGDWVDDWWRRSKKPTKVRIPLHEGILTIWRQLNIELAKHNQQNKEMLDYYLRILCLHIERHIMEQTAHPLEANSYLAYRMKHFIEEHSTTSLTLEQVARHVGLSVSRAVHLFKSIFDQSIMQHAIEVRLAIAKERILYSSFTLEQIAESCGYASYSYFHRMFRAHFGISPKDYRLRER